MSCLQTVFKGRNLQRRWKESFGCQMSRMYIYPGEERDEGKEGEEENDGAFDVSTIKGKLGKRGVAGPKRSKKGAGRHRRQEEGRRRQEAQAEGALPWMQKHSCLQSHSCPHMACSMSLSTIRHLQVLH